MNIIETKNLTKSYAGFTAVSGINLHIPKGAVYGFLGPNGAGKSTTMKMFLGLTKPTGGSFTIDGKQYSDNRVQILKEIGSFIEAPAFYGNLSGEENTYQLQLAVTDVTKAQDRNYQGGFHPKDEIPR